MWLDLQNAYGSVRHNLIQFALKWYHVPEWFTDLVFQYYEVLAAFVSTPEWNSKWFHYLIGIFQGCVIAPTLFILVYQIIIDFMDHFGTDTYRLKLDEEEKRTNVFVDDHTLVASSVKGMDFNMKQLSSILNWTDCLRLKPKKCWCLGLADLRFKKDSQSGISYGPFDPKLKVYDTDVNFLGNNFFTFLGRKVYADLKNKEIVSSSLKAFSDDLNLIDSAFLNGPSKGWLYQFMAISRVIWFFSIYPVSETDAKKFEHSATRCLKKWYNLNHSVNPNVLYLPKYCHGWGFTSPVTLMKFMQIGTHHILKNSNDPTTSALHQIARLKAANSNSNRWKPELELDRLDGISSFVLNFGLSRQVGRQGLGFGKNLSHGSSLRDKRKAITNLCKKEEAEARIAILRSKAMASTIVKWDEIMINQIDWTDQIMRMSPDVLSFTINAQCQACPSPDNLRRWGYNSVAKCLLCGKPGATTKHILAGCPVALNQHRYTWRHDNVLLEIMPSLSRLVKRANKRRFKLAPQSALNHFVSPGRTHTRFKSVTLPAEISFSKTTNLLSTANDWELSVDINHSLSFPPCTGIYTSQRPDVIIYSKSTKRLIWGELTCPIEENVLEAQTRKERRYAQLEVNLRQKGWFVHAYTWEVGALGFLATSVRKFLTALGFPKDELRFLFKRIGNTCRRSTFFIWNSRHSLTWNPPTIVFNNLVPCVSPVKPPKSRPTSETVQPLPLLNNSNLMPSTATLATALLTNQFGPNSSIAKASTPATLSTALPTSTSKRTSQFGPNSSITKAKPTNSLRTSETVQPLPLLINSNQMPSTTTLSTALPARSFANINQFVPNSSIAKDSTPTTLSTALPTRTFRSTNQFDPNSSIAKSSTPTTTTTTRNTSIKNIISSNTNNPSKTLILKPSAVFLKTLDQVKTSVLPPNWEARKDELGIYFRNSLLKTTTRTDPRPLPPGFEARTDIVSGLTYYLNFNIKKTQWQDPRPPLQSRPRPQKKKTKVSPFKPSLTPIDE